MKEGTINDITNLKFYTDKGYEIPTEKLFILTWEWSTYDSSVALYFKSSPSGYFIGDVDVSDSNNIQIKEDTLKAGIINEGELLMNFEDIPYRQIVDVSTENIIIPTFSYGVDDPSLRPTELDKMTYLVDMLFSPGAAIKVAINIEDHEVSDEYSIGYIFDKTYPDVSTSEEYKKYYSYRLICTGDNLDGNYEYYGILGLKLCWDNLHNYEDASTGRVMPFIQWVFEKNVPNIGLYFPFIRYSAAFYLDPISTNFLDVNTMVLLEHSVDEDDNDIYEKPYINSENDYTIKFQPLNDGELHILKVEDNYNITYADYAGCYLADPEVSTTSVTPYTFTIGVISDVEGAYQNFLGIYMSTTDDNDKEYVFFMGAITVKTEIIGEDERFRTLLGNFGVPDPIRYPNIFAEQDYQELGIDYLLVNKKSKELMLTYDLIFSYVGTYKALFKAIKFLGYNDIVFKEWYSILDSNDLYTDIAVLVFDTSTGEMLKQKLADYGISPEDFYRYNKLNKLTMIYHLNEEDEDNYEYLTEHLAHYDKSSNTVKVDSGEITKLSEVPLTKPIYEYRNEEIIAKLFAVKHWLEEHIIGVNAYISDITGEGVYFGWEKTQGYNTEHYLADYSQYQYYTPDVKVVLPFVQSTGKIACTLNELNDAIKFDDYEYTPIEAFVKYSVPVSMDSSEGVIMDVSELYISNTVEAPVMGDEYEFDLVNRPETGTLYEWTKSGNSLILYKEGEIQLLFEGYSEAEIDASCLPIITLENCNIHRCFGKWQDNIEWVVREVIDQETGNTNYKLKNYGTYRSDSAAIYNNNYFVLKPSTKEGITPSIKYSENNKWKLPMFIIKGYEFEESVINAPRNTSIIEAVDSSKIDRDYISLLETLTESKAEQYDLGDGEFILEILKGDMLFKDVDGCGVQVSFSADKVSDQNSENIQTNMLQELDIQFTYTYHSDRKAFTIIKHEGIQSDIDSSVFDYPENEEDIENCQELNDDFYDDIIQRREDFLKTNLRMEDNVAKDEAEEYILDASFIEDYEEFLKVKKEQEDKKSLYTDYLKIFDDNYICNKTIDAKVTRLGNYDIISRAYDRFNNVFVNKYDKQARVTAKPMDIDVYTMQPQSNNSSDFYLYNKYGSLCSTTDIENIILEADDQPLFPKNYHIYSFDYNYNNNTMAFDNISYAIDTPKKNDYLFLENYTEICTGMESVDSSTIKLSMLDENPCSVNLYNPSTMIQICVYDTVLKRDVVNVGPFEVIESYYQPGNTDESYEDQSYIVIKTDAYKQLNRYINNINRYQTYILNVTEHTITSDMLSDVSRGTYRTTITINEPYQYFKSDDVIKARYYKVCDVSTKVGTIINETAYRVLETSAITTSTGIVTGYTYKINGVFNEQILEDPTISIVLTYAHENSVHYVTRVTTDGYEFQYKLGYDNTYMIRDRFKYNASQLFLNDYLDDTFSGSIVDYDQINLKKIWFDPTTMLDANNTELYYYHNFPLTVPKGRRMIFKANDTTSAFVQGFHTEWKWSNNNLDDIQEWDTATYVPGNEVLFRSVNEYLSVRPELLGSLEVSLICTDKYGNRLINEGSGKVYVKDSSYESDYYINNNLITYLKPSGAKAIIDTSFNSATSTYTVTLSEENLDQSIKDMIEYNTMAENREEVTNHRLYLTVIYKTKNIIGRGHEYHRHVKYVDPSTGLDSSRYDEKTWQKEDGATRPNRYYKDEVLEPCTITPEKAMKVLLTTENCFDPLSISVSKLFDGADEDKIQDSSAGTPVITFRFALIDETGRKYHVQSDWHTVDLSGAELTNYHYQQVNA